MKQDYIVVQYNNGVFFGVIAGMGRNKRTWDANHSKRTAMKYCKQLNAENKTDGTVYQVETAI